MKVYICLRYVPDKDEIQVGRVYTNYYDAIEDVKDKHRIVERELRGMP